MANVHDSRIFGAHQIYEAIGKLAVALRIINGKRLLEVATRAGKVALKPSGHAIDAVSDAQLGACFAAGRVVQEHLGQFLHRRNLAAHVMAGP